MSLSPTTFGFSDEQIAEIAHDLVSSIRRLQGEGEALSWRELPEDAWQRADTLRQVALVRENPAYSARDDHEAWRRRRMEQGWSYGPTRDDARKLNPLLIPWEQLSSAERIRGAANFEIIRILLGRV